MIENIPKINIIFEFTLGPYGGGNQFIKALKNYFIEKGVYEERIENADILLFNSDHVARSVLEAKRKLSEKIFVHRLAGPIYIARGSNKNNDRLIYRLNKYIADGTIFQSNWSRKENYKAGLASNTYDTTITNAPDKRIFSQNNKNRRKIEDKVKLIATSWSSNLRKGFEIYKYLDENLDFKKFAFTFVGNSPFQFNNIRHIPPQSTTELVKILSEHDIFITASRFEACSNSLIEAMHCGLPAVVWNDTSNPEILKEWGVTFNSSDDVIAAIQKVLKNYEYYSRNIILPSISEVGNTYYEFCKNIFDDYREGKYHLKKLNYLQYYFIRLSLPDFILARMTETAKALIWQRIAK